MQCFLCHLRHRPYMRFDQTSSDVFTFKDQINSRINAQYLAVQHTEENDGSKLPPELLLAFFAGKDTGDNGAAIGTPMNIDRAVNHLGAVAHDLQSHAFFFSPHFREIQAVAFYRQC